MFLLYTKSHAFIMKWTILHQSAWLHVLVQVAKWVGMSGIFSPCSFMQETYSEDIRRMMQWICFSFEKLAFPVAKEKQK